MIGLVFHGALLGLGANLLFDLWQRGLALATGQPAPNWAPIGRWFWHLREGRVFHDDIMRAAPYAHELAARLDRALCRRHPLRGDLRADRRAGVAGGAKGAAGVDLRAGRRSAFGWFLLQPGLGMGWAASKTPDPGRVRLLNLAGHTVFGLGLWLTGLLIG